jgi:hypothetical protein
MKNICILSVCICLLSGCVLNLPDPIADMGYEDSGKTGPTPQIVYDGKGIASDNNGNKMVNSGETIWLYVFLKNTGTGTATGVKAAFSTTSGYISNLLPAEPVIYGDISTGRSLYADQFVSGSHGSIKFTVHPSTPPTTQIPFNIGITDDDGNTWTASFNVTVQ